MLAIDKSNQVSLNKRLAIAVCFTLPKVSEFCFAWNKFQKSYIIFKHDLYVLVLLRKFAHGLLQNEANLNPYKLWIRCSQRDQSMGCMQMQ
jgi:hypothetical protein